MSISSMLPSLSLFFDINKIKGDTTGSIQPDQDRLVWLKDKTQPIDMLDSFIRAKFNIPTQSKMVFSLYLPPSSKTKILNIKKQVYSHT